jgi:hypothetical protein
MAIQDGMRTHDEGNIHKYRMPDLLSYDEMRIYFAGTYGVDIEIKPLSDEMRERATGVGTLPAPTTVGDRDRETALLRKQLGLEELEVKLDVVSEGRVKELDSRTMTREQFAEKYGEQPPVETPEEKEARLNPSSENEESTEESVIPEQTDEQKQASQEQAPPQNPSGALERLLQQQKNK